MKVTIIDTESASLKRGIVQIANIVTDENLSKIEKASVTLVNPLCKIDCSASGVHFIREEHVIDAPKFSDIAQEYIPSEGYLIAHNAPFDVRMLSAEGYDLPENVKVLDTLELARQLVNKSQSGDHKLGTLFHFTKAYELMGDYTGNAHDALYDCYLLFYTLKRLLEIYELSLEDAWELINTPIQDKQCDMKKYRDQDITWQQVFDEAPDYCQWILDNYNFDYHKQGKELKVWLKEILGG